MELSGSLVELLRAFCLTKMVLPWNFHGISMDDRVLEIPGRKSEKRANGVPENTVFPCLRIAAIAYSVLF